MSDPMFAWVKQIDIDKKAPEFPPCHPSLTVMSGDRPPTVAALQQQKTAGGKKQYPPGVQTFCDGGRLRLIADSAMHASWILDPSFTGDAKPFEVTQFIGSRDEAKKWLLSTPEGQRWLSNAESVALIRVNLPAAVPATATATASREAVALEQVSAMPPPYQPAFPVVPCKAYPEDEWRANYVDAVTAPSGLFDEPELAALFAEAVDKLAVSESKDECQAVGDLVQQQPLRRHEILEQASDMMALKRVVDPVDSLFSKPATLQLLDKLREGLRRPIFQLKWHFGRGRPWACCTNLPLVMGEGDPLFPAHAAYPAGHATFAHVAAALMGDAVPRLKPGCDDRARQIALNRVIAGFHWPTDNEAGEKLAQLITARLRAKPEIQLMLADVTAEWG